jgi:hypothetical protein
MRASVGPVNLEIDRPPLGEPKGELEIERIDATRKRASAARAVPVLADAQRHARQLAATYAGAACAYPLITAATNQRGEKPYGVSYGGWVGSWATGDADIRRRLRACFSPAGDARAAGADNGADEGAALFDPRHAYISYLVAGCRVEWRCSHVCDTLDIGCRANPGGSGYNHSEEPASVTDFSLLLP